MADTTESDGVKNIGTDDSNNDDVCVDGTEEEDNDVNLELSNSPVTKSSVKRVQMEDDKDCDGAPSSIETSPKRQKDEGHKGQGDGGSIVSFDSSAESTPRRNTKSMSTTPRSSSARGPGGAAADLSILNMTTSWDGSMTTKAGLLADPAKIAKEREKEERVRQARERLAEERRKKLEELKEQQRAAQENREKQLEIRRRKIEDLRRRDVERRAKVEERRKIKEEMERVRRESILQKAEERMTRYEQWKAGGRKGMFGMDTSSAGRQLSVSTSVLYHKRNPDYTSTGVLSPAPRPESALGTNSTWSGTSPGSYHYTRQSTGSANTNTGTNCNNSMTASMPSPVRLRDKSAPRKQRPASVASSMPSFVSVEPARSPRCKSTDRNGRDRSKTRPKREKSKVRDSLDGNSAKSKDDDKDAMADGGGEKKEKKVRVSTSFFDRLSTPKLKRGSQEPVEKEKSPKNPPLQRLSPRKAFSTTNLASTTLRKRSSLREKPVEKEPSTTPKAKETTPKPTGAKDKDGTPRGASGRLTPKRSPAKEVPPSARGVSASADTRAKSPATGGKSSTSSTPQVTPPPSTCATPTPSATEKLNTTEKPAATEDGTTTPRNTASQDITAEEYKARLAEKRRQAREKAEREAEEERKRQEEARLAEEERIRQEEEEQRRFEEEALRLAAEQRKAEEERLQKAIEAEDQRRKEEEERLEEERKAKEEADRIAKEEAEKLEKEKQERARREEEERLQRKKKLEMIMKRVKPADSNSSGDKATDSPTKSINSSPNISVQGSTQNSPEEHAKPIVQSTDETTTTAHGNHSDSDSRGTSSPTEHLSSSSVVRSASSGDILDGSSSHTDTQEGRSHSLTSTPARSGELTDSPDSRPKFKSPLLQQLVDNKSNESSNSSPQFKSPLLNNLLNKTRGARMGLSSSMSDLSQNKDSGNNTSSMSQSQILGNSDSDKEISKHGMDEDKDEDTLDTVADKCVSNNTSIQEHHGLVNGLSDSMLPSSMMNDSALGTSITPLLDSPGDVLQSKVLNGHTNGLVDSSIGLQSSPEGISTSASHTEELDGENGHFEELIDLIDTTSTKSNPLVSGPPIIAFDENRRVDITESLS